VSALVADILQQHSSMTAQRVNFDSTWQRIAELIDPDNALFTQKLGWQGQRRDQFQFDSTGQLALGRFASIMESVISPRTQQWHALAPSDDTLRKNRKVMAWCEEATRRLFRARYAPVAGFVSASSEHYRALGAYGNGCTYVEDIPGRTLRYSSEFIGHLSVARDAWGLVNVVHREFVLTVAQAQQKFKTLPPRFARERPDREFTFIHCVRPRKDRDPQRKDFRGMAFGSYYVCTDAPDAVIDEGGFRTMPYIYSMYETAPGETYGRGPASKVLPTLNTINEQQKTILRAGQLAVRPPLLLPDEDVLSNFSMRESALNYGAIDSMGQPRVLPLNTGANIPVGLELVQDARSVINDAFFVTLFQILVENPRMTATEALLRAQEKGELLGPPAGRQQTTYLGPLIERELDLLDKAGVLDDMPRELEEAGGFLEIEYTSPLDRFQRAQEGAGIMQTVETLGLMAQYDPKAMRVMNFERAARRMAEVAGAPADILNDEAEMAAMDEADAAQQNMAMMLEAAPAAGKAAKDLAQAQQIAGAGGTAGLLGAMGG
jgi:hypothetical protein